VRGHVRAPGGDRRGHVRQGVQGCGHQNAAACGAEERQAGEREGGLSDHGRARD